MKSKTEAEYQEWIKEVESKLSDPGDREAFKRLAGAPAGQELFGGHLREADYYRRLNSLTEEQRAVERAKAETAAQRAQFDRDVAAVDEWFKREEPQRQFLKQERDALRMELAATKERLKEVGMEDYVATPKTETSNVYSRAQEELIGEVAALRNQLAGISKVMPVILADTVAISNRLAKDGYDIDPKAVFAYATSNSVDLNRAYEDVTWEQRQKREAAERSKEIEKAKEEARREVLSKVPAAAQFRPAGPSILDSINKPTQQTSQGRVDAAVASYMELANQG